MSRTRPSSAALLLVLVLGLSGCTTSEGTSEPDRRGAPTASPPAPGGEDRAEVEGVEEYEIEDSTHTDEDVRYPQTPPVGGQHAKRWAPCGVSEEPLVDEEVVHTLEHGVVWVTYRPGLDQDAVATLEALHEEWERVVVSPHEEQDAPVTLTAWGRQLSLEDALDPRVEEFVEAHLDSENAPEPGASCEPIPEQLPEPAPSESTLDL